MLDSNLLMNIQVMLLLFSKHTAKQMNQKPTKTLTKQSIMKNNRIKMTIYMFFPLNYLLLSMESTLSFSCSLSFSFCMDTLCKHTHTHAQKFVASAAL